jgi:hypothetical protein
MKRTNNQKMMNKDLINIKEVRNLLVIMFIVFRSRWYAWNGWPRWYAWYGRNGWNAWNGRRHGRNAWNGRRHGWNARHGHAENDVINANGITRRP